MAIDGWLAARPGRVRNLLLATALTTAALLPLVLPVLPDADVGWTYKVDPINGDSIGWPQLVQAVQQAWLSLPPAQRAHAVIFTDNYGEAGAINELGRADGLPTAVSGHNADWWWGPGNPRATTVIAVTPGPAGGSPGTNLEGFFTSVTPVATLSNPAGIHNQEWGGQIYRFHSASETLRSAGEVVARIAAAKWGRIAPSGIGQLPSARKSHRACTPAGVPGNAGPGTAEGRGLPPHPTRTTRTAAATTAA